MMRLTAINPIILWIGIILYNLVVTYLVWGDYKILFCNYSSILVYWVFYSISTFEIRAREEDQENTFN